jgi:hypothetical protein
MSGPKRAYNLLRGYVGREWERIQGVERHYAERELEEALEQPAPIPERRIEEVRIEDRNEHARRLLGVPQDASYAEVRRAFERLNRRSDPENFPEKSPERAQAAEIQKRVNWAYRILSENVDPTERRFRNLEIE